MDQFLILWSSVQTVSIGIMVVRMANLIERTELVFGGFSR